MDRRKKTGIVMILVAALMAAAALLWGGTRPLATGDNADPIVPQEVIDILTVNVSTIKCVDIVGAENVETTPDGQQVVRPNIGALKSVPPRKWTDALSTPLDPNTRKAVQRAICQDPLLGSTTAHMLSRLKVGDVSVLELNPWLKPFAGKASRINNVAVQYVPQLKGTATIDEAIKANVAWQKQAELINTLLGRFKVQGVHKLKSTKNYHLTGGGLDVGGLPNVGLDPKQDKRSALILAVTAKNSKKCVLKIGFNLGDKRPEQFGCPKPTTPGTTPSVPGAPGSPGTPGTPGKPGSTPTPGTSTPGSTPTPTPTPTPSGKGTRIPKADPAPAASTPNPVGTAPAPTRPAPADPTPSNGLPVHDVNPPAVPEQPDSGSGATNTVAPSNVPVAPSAPAPAPADSTPATGIVGSD